jgi:hypothetical protein
VVCGPFQTSTVHIWNAAGREFTLVRSDADPEGWHEGEEVYFENEIQSVL